MKKVIESSSKKAERGEGERRRLLIYMKTNGAQSDKKRFDKIINDIEAELDIGVKIPPFGSVVKTGKLNQQLQNLRKEVYIAIEEAQQIVAYKEKLLSEAHQKAEEIVRRRQMELSKVPVLKEAEEIAKSMLIQTKKETERMRKEARDFQEQVKERSYRYADMIYNELESKLSENHNRITRNREDLKTILEENKNAEKSPNTNFKKVNNMEKEQRKYS